MGLSGNARNAGCFRRNAIRRTSAFVLAVALATSIVAAAPLQRVDEYRVKAAFLYNFAKFVDWPADAFQTPNSSITICVLGPDPFGHSLEEAVAGREIESRSLAFRNISNMKQVAGCHILFIRSAGNKRVAAMVREIKASGILTVGESDTAIADGVVINFTREGAKVHFEINLAAAERERLRISSRLLSLARVVGPGQKP